MASGLDLFAQFVNDPKGQLIDCIRSAMPGSFDNIPWVA